jgi:hypothetical protein
MKLQRVFPLAALVTACVAIVACNPSTAINTSTGGTVGSGGSGSGGTPGSGGATGSGGTQSGSGGGGGSCSNVTPCGGDVVGTWTASSSCLKVSGILDASLAGLDPTVCTNMTIAGSLNVSGTWTANANGTYTDGTTTSGNAEIQVPAACKLLSGTTFECNRLGGPMGSGTGYTITCTDAASGGGCTCTATAQQTGWAGVMTPDALTSGNYTTSSNVLTLDDEAKYSYCVSGNTMTWTPQIASPTITGTVVLQKPATGRGGTTGSAGGATGKGGATGSGGVTGGGGVTGRGGQTGSGGATTSSGGATGSGGATRTGGTIGAGGTTGSGGRTGGGGATGTGGSVAAGGSTGSLPCDLYAAASTPCVAAYSMARVIVSGYTGPLYQVRKGGGSKNTGTGGTTTDIGVAGGYADSATQDTFCGTDCTVSILYDQSGKKNDLKVAPAGCYSGTASEPDWESSATKKTYNINGHKVYGLYMNAHEGYRNNKCTGIPTGNTDQGLYVIADGTHAGAACCWDFGNTWPDNCNGHTMNPIFFGTGYWGTGAGSGPWFMGDFEGGVWAGGSGAANANNPSNPSMKVEFAFGILKTSSGKYAIKAGNAQSGNLTTAYDGASPKTWSNGGAVMLGIGGDNSNSSFGTFYEGAMTTGRPSDAADTAVFQNVQAAGFGK